MNLSVSVAAVGGTSQRELAELTDELRDNLERHPAVQDVTAAESASPTGAKGIGQMLGALLVNLPASGIPAVVDIIKAVLSRPAQPPVKIKLTAEGGEFEFDPRQVNLDQLAAFVTAVRAKPGG
jgi:hypothetical protein